MQMCIYSFMLEYIFTTTSEHIIVAKQKVVHPLKQHGTLVFFDKSIHQPSYISFIRKDTNTAVYMIDASFLDEVTFKHPYKLLITPNYSFEEKHMFYIKFEKRCGGKVLKEVNQYS